MTELACLDGQVAPAEETYIPATDEGLLRGDGVFEVIRVYDGAPFALDDHLARMEASAANRPAPLPVPRSFGGGGVWWMGRGGAPLGGVLRLLAPRGGRPLLRPEP